MKFSTKNPDSEKEILILCEYDGGTNILQGQFFESEDGYFDVNGEEIEKVLGWTRLPDVEYF